MVNFTKIWDPVFDPHGIMEHVFLMELEKRALKIMTYLQKVQLGDMCIPLVCNCNYPTKSCSILQSSKEIVQLKP